VAPGDDRHAVVCGVADGWGVAQARGRDGGKASLQQAAFARAASGGSHLRRGWMAFRWAGDCEWRWRDWAGRGDFVAE